MILNFIQKLKYVNKKYQKELWADYSATFSTYNSFYLLFLLAR